ncbi:MAG: N-acetylmuramoyl-L-alanine amidase [Candidatus Paceibacterota bacterium]|jgi:hypothetical protein
MLLKKTCILLFLTALYLISFDVSSVLVEMKALSDTSLPFTPVKILIVPGHDKDSIGAQFLNLKEEEMTEELALKIYEELKNDERFDVYITRDESGYLSEFENYFTEGREQIISFIEEAKKRTKEKIKEGSYIDKSDIQHKVTLNTGVKLYGINKWIASNNIDTVIHIHFNDYSRKNKKVEGKYNGFAIYVPEEQMDNAEKSIVLAKNIFEQLETRYKTSNNVEEYGGIVTTQELIALGSNGTLPKDTSSVLIEYGYIYEFKDNFKRREEYEKMKNLTVNALKRYFFE